LSFTFALRGPAISVDTACSSSLVAAQLALHYVSDSQSGTGLVAGVGLIFNAAPSAVFRKVGVALLTLLCVVSNCCIWDDEPIAGTALPRRVYEARQGFRVVLGCFIRW